jgi:hypothetical protein
LEVSEAMVRPVVTKWAQKYGSELVIPMTEQFRYRELGFGGLLDPHKIPGILDREAKGLREAVKTEKAMAVAQADIERIRQEREQDLAAYQEAKTCGGCGLSAGCECF